MNEMNEMNSGMSSGLVGAMPSRENNMAIPEAKGAMNQFKEEVASELGVPLKKGYNGELTSRQAGSIGGEMVKQMIMKQEQQLSGDQTPS